MTHNGNTTDGSEKIDSKDEALRKLLYVSSFGDGICVALYGDTPIDGELTDEFERELREILNE